MKKKLLLAVLGGLIAVGGILWLPGVHRTGIPSDWEIYTNSAIGFSIRHDPDLRFSQRSASDVSFYMLGPTQKGETEMYDGMNISFRKVRFSGAIADYMQQEEGQFAAVGQITAPLHDTQLGHVSAKTFNASTQGDFTIIFVPVDDSSLIEIAYLDPDPGKLGFQKQIDQILATFTLTAR